jgi:CheY-like chemotaxis protein
VDDDPFVRAVVHGVLAAVDGSAVKVCTSGDEALQAASDFRPDLILLDFLMPGMDGRATWAALRRTLSPIPPVIFLTARNDEAFLADIAALKAENPEICGVLAKPFEPASLVGEIRRLLESAPASARRPQREPAAKARRLAAVADAFRRSLPGTAARMSEAWKKLRDSGWAKDAAEALLADAHSLAGSAGLFDLKAIGAAAHDAERLLLNAVKAGRAPTASEFRTLANAVTALIAACRAAAPA